MVVSILESFNKVVESKSAIPILIICGVFGWLIYSTHVVTIVIPSLEANNKLAKSVSALAESLRIESINNDIDSALVNARVDKLQKAVASSAHVSLESLELTDLELSKVEKLVLKRYERVKRVATEQETE